MYSSLYLLVYVTHHFTSSLKEESSASVYLHGLKFGTGTPVTHLKNHTLKTLLCELFVLIHALPSLGKLSFPETNCFSPRSWTTHGRIILSVLTILLGGGGTFWAIYHILLHQVKISVFLLLPTLGWALDLKIHTQFMGLFWLTGLSETISMNISSVKKIFQQVIFIYTSL